MPWKETSVMEERELFINAVLENADTFKDNCIKFGISTKTGYKWFNRFNEDGLKGLNDHSRRPAAHPASLSEDTLCQLIELKLAHSSFGPKKILELYRRIHPSDAPSLSSVNRIFKKVGLVKKRRKRRASNTGRLTSNIAVSQPNDLWTIDFKGWWKSLDNKRIEPLTVRDEFSRYVLACEYLERTNTGEVMEVLKRLFREYGLPKAMQSDNGAPFASRSNVKGISRLSAWLITLGIEINRSRPGHPQDNGGHERMHKDLKSSVQVRFRGSARTYKAELEMWRDEFNNIRPHESLGMKTPAEVFRKSDRRYSGTPSDIDYPTEYQTRKVATTGYIKYDGGEYFISSSIRKYSVGLKVVDSAELAVYFAKVLLGIINLKTLSFSPVEK